MINGNNKWIQYAVCAMLVATQIIHPLAINATTEISPYDEKTVIVLSSAFSVDGNATEITRDYGSTITVPQATATVGSTVVPVTTSVRFLGAGGWTDYELSSSRQFEIGNVALPDRNRTAVYKVVYSAGENEQRNELVYTIYAGLQMFLTTEDELTAFVGDTIVLPECRRPFYHYKDADGTTQRIYFDATRQIVFYPAGEETSFPVINSGNTLIPDTAGIYEIIFTSPAVIEEEGTTYVTGSIERIAYINVCKERINPLSGNNGIYSCGYSISGTNDIGKGMARASCKNTIEIEKRDENYFLYFTLTAAEYMNNLQFEQYGRDIAGLITAEKYVNSAFYVTSAFVMDKEQLSDEINVKISIIPMDSTVSIIIKADLENAHYLSPSITPSPSEIPLIEADEINQGIAANVGTKLSIPQANVIFSGQYALGYTVNLDVNGKQQPVQSTNGVFTPEETGMYVIKYYALILADNNPYAVTLERSIHVDDANNIPLGIILVVGMGVIFSGVIGFVMLRHKKKVQLNRNA